MVRDDTAMVGRNGCPFLGALTLERRVSYYCCTAVCTITVGSGRGKDTSILGFRFEMHPWPTWKILQVVGFHCSTRLLVTWGATALVSYLQ